MIAVIDYGAGNLQSVVKALNYIDCECVITDDKKTILECEGAILPGVGSFEDAMNCLIKTGCDRAVCDFVNTGKPLLGICLGLQLLFDESEESPGVRGLGLLKGSVRRIPDNNGSLKIPHMGWNSLDIKIRKGLFKDIEGEPYVYFVHSYYLHAEDRSIVSSNTEYGTLIDASVSAGNIYATQFHPEKSGDVGLRILENFVAICRR